jgi:hypothetical protein
MDEVCTVAARPISTTYALPLRGNAGWPVSE